MVFAISWLWNRYLDICRFKKDRQGRRRWWLQNDACTVPGFDYRISSLAISTLHAKREKEGGTIDLKFLLSITILFFLFFFPFIPPFSPSCSWSLFSTNFSVTHSSTITCKLFLQWKIEKSKLLKNRKNIDYIVS